MLYFALGVQERAKRDLALKEVEKQEVEYNEEKLKEKVKIYDKFMSSGLYVYPFLNFQCNI